MSIPQIAEHSEIILLVGDLEEVTDVSSPGLPPGAFPEAEVKNDRTAECNPLPCPSCQRPPGKVIATGATSDYQMGVRWTVNQLRNFLQGYMSPSEARAITEKFAEIVVED